MKYRMPAESGLMSTCESFKSCSHSLFFPFFPAKSPTTMKIKLQYYHKNNDLRIPVKKGQKNVSASRNLDMKDFLLSK